MLGVGLANIRPLVRHANPSKRGERERGVRDPYNHGSGQLAHSRKLGR